MIDPIVVSLKEALTGLAIAVGMVFIFLAMLVILFAVLSHKKQS